MLEDLIVKNRSYRRFFQDEKISRQTLEELVNLARLSSSGANLQPLKYYLANDESQVKRIFSTLSWAGYLKNWLGPENGEQPSAYIVILGDKRITENFHVDLGIAAQSIMLGAVEKGLGGCMIASIQRNLLKEYLELPDYLDILLVLALGKPKENVILSNVNENGDIRYYRDNEQSHFVPKRTLEEILIN